jgi:peptidoglycan hydrolase-like protein with peptidoglycan-binding domain
MNTFTRRLATALLPVALAGTAVLASTSSASADELGLKYADACLAHGTITVNGIGDLPAQQVSYGWTGDCVKYAQALLVDWRRLPGPSAVDGQFGPQTYAAVTGMQQWCRIAVDGIVGPNTWYCMVTRAD